jgi:hypothetical protein
MPTGEITGLIFGENAVEWTTVRPGRDRAEVLKRHRAPLPRNTRRASSPGL